MSAFLSSAFLLPFTVSLLVSWGIVWTRHWHGRYSFDSLSGVQKVHIGQVPRIGGMAIFLGFCSADIFLSNGAQSILNPLLLLGLIAFSFGLLEDLTKQVSVTMRLWATMIPGVVGYFLTGYTLNQFGYGWLDLLLSWPIVSIAFTAFAICGVTHAMNMIDGFNGLSAWVTVWILLGIVGMALSVDDVHLASVALFLLASTAGFLLVNWPWGKLFLGDGGSYFLGVSIAWLCVVLVSRNPQISPFACLVLCSYPIIEVLYSIARRAKARMSSGKPDQLHLHQLIAKSFLYPRLKGRFSPVQKNSITGFVVSTFSIASLVLAVTFAQSQSSLIACFGVLVLLYIALYQWVRTISAAQRSKEHAHASESMPSGLPD